MRKKWIVGILSIVVLICAGIYVYANAFTLQGRVDRENNAIFLEWNISDKSEPYTYRVYQKKEGSSEFQSISTADLKERIRVLNVYPGTGSNISYTTWDGERVTIPKSGSLEMWMEAPNSEHPKGYGMGLIEVDNVLLSDFNAEPEKYLKNSKGEWQYDSIYFGAWDDNGYPDHRGDLSEKSRDVIEEFINSGRGVLFGHDTFHGNKNYHPNFASLRHYANIKLRDFDSVPVPNFVGSDEVAIRRRGLLLEFPWKIGDIGTVLSIPYTHSTYEISLGDIWMDFVNLHVGTPVSDPATGKGTSNFYLSSWNNTAMIQTGHSNGAATPDEQKVLANTLFYLSQLTNKTSHLDRSGLDLKGPEPVKNLTYNPETNRVSFSEPIDNGSTYQYYVEAIGQDTGRVKRSNTITITNTSGVKGYSYVIDDKPNTEPDDIIDATSDSFELNLSEATGNILHIKAIDYAGNSSETAHFELQFLTLKGKVDHENNAIDLFWNKMPDRSQPYIYRVYQKKEGSEEFQSISTADLKEQVKVLNVYPEAGPDITYTTWDGTKRTIQKAASVEMWMETPNEEHPKGYGMGLIDVDPVSWSDFNENPIQYMRNSDGSWKYDVVFFGTWDANNFQDLTVKARDLVEEFIKSGRGVLFGHDVFDGVGNKNYTAATLAKYVNVKLMYFDELENIPNVGSTTVTLVKRGLLTSYPWDIGNLGRDLVIPNTHTGRQFAQGDVWIKFSNFENNPETNRRGPEITEISIGKGTNNFYLTTWNNTAMIQTGHSNGTATPDEQKVIANTLFYLSQLTNKTSHLDRSAMDVKGPKWSDTPQVSLESGDKMRVSNLKARDEGSTYEYYVEAIGMNDDRRFYSNTIRLTNTSGLQGFSYVVDDNPDTVPDNKVEVTGDSFTVNLSNGLKNWLHIAPVDRGGNVGEVLHIQIDTEPPTFTVKIEPEGWTNGPVSITLENMQDNGFGYARTKLPNGQFTTDVEPSYVVTKNGRYEFEVFDKVGNRKTAVIEITNIDKELPKVRINELGGEKDRKRIRLEYGD